MYIIHLGFTALPTDSGASNQRIKFTFKGLRLQGFYTLIINKESDNKIKIPYKICLKDRIPYVSTSILTYRHNNFLIRNLNKISGFIGELFLLTKKRKKIHTAILYTSSFGELLYYRVLSKLLKFKLIIQYVELRSSLNVGVTFLGRINDNLFDKYFFRYCDGVIAISNFLVNHVELKSSKLPVIKLPAICDFDEFETIKPFEGGSYIMYCGSIFYYDVIEFIIDVFCYLIIKKRYDGNLTLVISGNYEINWKKLHAKINSSEFANKIFIKRNLPYSELVSLYKGADALMIPLRNTLQDIARFPHKIGEYSASRRPIISTQIGEVKVYFEDGVSAILANEYSVNSYVQKLSETLSLKSKLDEIGLKGFEIGLNSFDYRAQGYELKEFIFKI